MDEARAKAGDEEEKRNRRRQEVERKRAEEEKRQMDEMNREVCDFSSSRWHRHTRAQKQEHTDTHAHTSITRSNASTLKRKSGRWTKWTAR